MNFNSRKKCVSNERFFHFNSRTKLFLFLSSYSTGLQKAAWAPAAARVVTNRNLGAAFSTKAPFRQIAAAGPLGDRTVIGGCRSTTTIIWYPIVKVRRPTQTPIRPCICRCSPKAGTTEWRMVSLGNTGKWKWAGPVRVDRFYFWAGLDRPILFSSWSGSTIFAFRPGWVV